MKHHHSSRRVARRSTRPAAIEPVEARRLMSAGAVDPTFGTGGIAVANEPFRGPSGSATVAVDGQGRELVGYSYNGANRDAGTIDRLTPAGTPDTTLGAGGTVTLTSDNDPFDDGRSGSSVNRVVPLANGNLLVAAGGGLLELTAAGALDTAFGTGGAIATGTAFAVQTDGRIVTAGADAGGHVVLHRFTAAGSVDASYGTGGAATSTAPYAGVGGLALDAAGRAVVSVAAGTTTPAGLVRFTTAGKLDATFGTAGTAAAAGDANAGPVAVAPDGTIYQVGVPTVSGADVDLFAYAGDGKHAAGGTVGTFATDVAPPAVVVGPDGRPIVSLGDTVNRFLPVDPTAAGARPQYDPSFAASGSVAPPVPQVLAVGGGGYVTFDVNGLALDANGNVLAVSVGSNADPVVSRILTAGPSAVTPAVDQGKLIGSPESYANQGNTAAKAFDGSLTTFYDAAHATGDWAGQDLGAAARPVVQVQFAPRPGWAFRMVGGRFQVSSTADFTADVHTIYTVTATPPTGVLTTVAVGSVGAYRYARYIGPTNGFGNVAEVRFLVAGATQLPGVPFGTAGSYRNQGNTFANAFDGDPATFVDGPAADGNTAGLDLGSARTVTQVRFAPRPGYAARMVGGTIQASNSATFAAGVVTAYTVAAAPPAGTLTAAVLSPTLGAYRYWRYVGPAGSYGNIAELELDG